MQSRIQDMQMQISKILRCIWKLHTFYIDDVYLKYNGLFHQVEWTFILLTMFFIVLLVCYVS